MCELIYHLQWPHSMQIFLNGHFFSKTIREHYNHTPTHSLMSLMSLIYFLPTSLFRNIVTQYMKIIPMASAYMKAYYQLDFVLSIKSSCIPGKFIIHIFHTRTCHLSQKNSANIHIMMSEGRVGRQEWFIVLILR